MYAHPGARLLYLAHPKTASRATQRALMQQAGFVASDDHHARLHTAQARLGITSLAGWTVFCTVRHPLDVLVSWKHERQIPDELWTPERFTEAVEWMRPWVRPGHLWFHADDCDRVLRYERVAADLNAVLSDHGLAPVRLDPWNVSRRPKGDWRDHYTPALQAVAAAMFQRELKRFGYSIDPPEQRP